MEIKKEQFKKAVQSIPVVEEMPTIKEYKLMYLFGAWVTSACIYAESDKEAIFDADELPKVAADKLQYALFCGNRKIKTYPAPKKPFCKIIK